MSSLVRRTDVPTISGPTCAPRSRYERRLRAENTDLRSACDRSPLSSCRPGDGPRLPLYARVHLVQQPVPVGELEVLGQVTIGLLARRAIERHVQGDQT